MENEENKNELQDTQKKSWIDKIKDAKAKADKWADNHPFLGFAYNHPLLFAGLVVVSCLVVGCAVKSSKTSDYDNVESSVAPPIVREKMNAQVTGASFDGYTDYYYLAGQNANTWSYGAGYFDYKTQVVTITGYSSDWNGLNSDYKYRSTVYDDDNYFAIVHFDTIVQNFEPISGQWDKGIGLIVDRSSIPSNVEFKVRFSAGNSNGNVGVCYPIETYKSSRQVIWISPQTLRQTSTDSIWISFSFDVPTSVIGNAIKVDFIGVDSSTVMSAGNCYVSNLGPCYVKIPSYIPQFPSDSEQYRQALDAGYKNGYRDGTEDMEIYGNTRYQEGVEFGDAQGYIRGVEDGSNKDMTLVQLFWYVIDEPFAVIYRLLNFDILGVNVFGFVCGIFTLGLIGFVIKMVI